MMYNRLLILYSTVLKTKLILLQENYKYYRFTTIIQGQREEKYVYSPRSFDMTCIV